MARHTSVSFKWLKQIEEIKKHRDEFQDLNITYYKKKLNKKLRESSLGSLLER